MKKRISLLTGILAVGVLSALAIGTTPKAMQKANAGAQKQNVVIDGFNDAAYKGSYNHDKWISTGNNKLNQTLTTDSYLHNDGKAVGNGETSMFALKENITNLKKLQFDIRFSSQNQCEFHGVRLPNGRSRGSSLSTSCGFHANQLSSGTQDAQH